MRRALVVPLLMLALAPALPGQARDAPAPGARPVAPVVIEGACPFECCQYGTWRLLRRAKPRREPRRDAPTEGTIAAWTRLNADTGFVRVTRLGLLQVVEGWDDQSEGGMPFIRGDTVVLLDYQGEGSYNAWYRGRYVSSPDGDSSASNGFRMLQQPETEWWAHVRWIDHGRAQQGWLHMQDVSVSGSDGCG